VVQATDIEVRIVL